MVYTIASPDEYLAITGAGIKTVKITKSAWIWPFQKCQRFCIQPRDYSLSLQAMSKEKLQFMLPVVFTVGPDVNQRGATLRQTVRVPRPGTNSDNGEDRMQDIIEEFPEDKGDALVKYAMLLAEANRPGVSGMAHVDKIVTGIIEGETRVLVSSFSMEEIFTNRESFKNKISAKIGEELCQFGLKIYNANVKELRDAPGSSYFESLSRKAHEGAVNQAKIDVAEAQRKGTVGEAQRQGEQSREIAKINAETSMAKTELDSDKAKAEATLATRKTAYNRDVSLAQIEATRATEVRDEELRKAVEVKRAQTELERLRASDVVKATILRESKQQAADAKNYEEQARSNALSYAEQKAADAHAYKLRIEAEAEVLKQENIANAAAYAEQKAADAYAYKLNVEAEARRAAAAKEAEAEFIRQQKAAAGMSAMAGAYKDLAGAFGGPAGLIQYLMIEKGVFTNLAQANADAVRGMNPKMTIWNTGATAGGGSAHEGTAMGGLDSIRNMYQMLPPLMETIQEQTGVTLPEWQFGRLNKPVSHDERGEYFGGKGKLTNGVNGTNGEIEQTAPQ